MSNYSNRMQMDTAVAAGLLPTLLFLLMSVTGSVWAQEPRPIVVHVLEPGDNPEIEAGETVRYIYDLKTPIPDRIRFYANVNFISTFSPRQNLSQSGNLDGARKSVVFDLSIPRDTKPGTYTLNTLDVEVGGTGYQQGPLPIKFSVRVDPTFVLPEIEGTFRSELTKAQLLRSRAKEIDTRLSTLLRDPNASPGANRTLILATLQRTVHFEIEALKKTKEDYLRLVSDPKAIIAAGIAFDDLVARYAKVQRRIQIDAASESSLGPHIVLVQQSKNTGLTALRQDVINDMDGTERAYLSIATFGEYVPPILVQTFPPGATITYYRDDEPPRPAPKISDVTVEFLEWAEWTFAASLDGYFDAKVPYDPYEDTHRVVEIKLKKKP